MGHPLVNMLNAQKEATDKLRAELMLRPFEIVFENVKATPSIAFIPMHPDGEIPDEYFFKNFEISFIGFQPTKPALTSGKLVVNIGANEVVSASIAASAFPAVGNILNVLGLAGVTTKLVTLPAKPIALLTGGPEGRLTLKFSPKINPS